MGVGMPLVAVVEVDAAEDMVSEIKEDDVKVDSTGRVKERVSEGM